MNDDQLRELFKRASDIASVVPESMHEAAFNRALEAITGRSQAGAGEPSDLVAPRPKSKKGQKDAPEDEGADPAVSLSQLDRSLAADVDRVSGAQAKALALLLVARRELGIDGLTGPQIASVLTDKFRARVSRQAINQAMDRAGNQVDRRKVGNATRYLIMQAGEDWLAALATEQATSGSTNSKSTPAGRRRPKKRVIKSTSTVSTSATPEGKGSKPGTTAKRPSTRRASGGPKASVETLIEAGWFKSPRELNAVRTELAHRLARRYKASDLSPAMTRLLREGKLHRSKNASGQYEYQS